jgi:hypothetical protein
MSFESAQRLYDMQSDDSSFSDEELDQEEIDNQYEDIDKAERLFVQAKKLIL